MDKNSNGILRMILNMYTIYTKYLNEANHINKQYNQISIITLTLQQELQISNNEMTKAITLLEVQIVKLNYYKKIIDIL